MEDFPQPSNIEELLKHGRPRTNPVNLIFVLAQYAPKISEQHFFPPRDFFDLFMRPTLSSRSRATAFLWLIWWYLESDFSYEDSQRNPFGEGVADGEGPLPPKVPPLEILTEEQAEEENIDTEEEREYGEAKRIERLSQITGVLPREHALMQAQVLLPTTCPQAQQVGRRDRGVSPCDNFLRLGIC